MGTTTNGNGSKIWSRSELGKVFHKAHSYRGYTMTFNAALEGEMRDASLSKEARVLSAVRRLAWGNFSDWATVGEPIVENKPRDPITQEWLASSLGMSKTSVNEAVRFLTQQGYFREHVYLFPEEIVKPKESDTPDEDEDKGPDFKNFRDSYLQSDADEAARLSQWKQERDRAREEAKDKTQKIQEIERKILCFFSKWKKEQKAKQEGETKEKVERTVDSYRGESGDTVDSYRGEPKTGQSRISKNGKNTPKAMKTEEQSFGPPRASSNVLNIPSKIDGEGGHLAQDAKAPPPPPNEILATMPKYALLLPICERYGLADEAGVVRMVGNVLAVRPDASCEEIAHFVNVLATKKLKAGEKRSLSGLLIRHIPEYFSGRSFEMFRARQREAEPRQDSDESTVRRLWETGDVDAREQLEGMYPEYFEKEKVQ